MKKVYKGCLGYIKHQRIAELIKAVVMTAISIALYLGGIAGTGSNKNILTYVAVLGCLPAAKFFVSYIVFRKAGGCSQALKEEFDKAGVDPTYYDLYFTSYKENYPVSAVYYNKGTLIGITENEKCDPDACGAHLAKYLKDAGFSPVVKIFNDKDKFIERYNELKKLNDEADNEFLYDNILSLSI